MQLLQGFTLTFPVERNDSITTKYKNTNNSYKKIITGYPYL